MGALGAISLATAFLAGCGTSAAGGTTHAAESSTPSTSASASTSQSAAVVDKTPFVVAFPSTPDVANLPLMVALHNMQKMGYKASYKVYNGTALAVDAVLKGSATVVNDAPDAVLKADVNGDNLAVFVQKEDNEFALVAQSKYPKVTDLNGVTLGDESPNSAIHALVLWTEQTYHIHPKDIYLPNSPVRAKALLAGRFGATVLEIDDMVKVLRAHPHSYVALIKYYKTLPWLLGIDFSAKMSYLKQHPTIIQTFVDQLFKATQQMYQNPQHFINIAPQYLSGYTQSVIAKTVQSSVKDQIWGPPNELEALTPSAAKKTYQFYRQTGVITANESKKLSSIKWYVTSFSTNALKYLHLPAASGSTASTSSSSSSYGG